MNFFINEFSIISPTESRAFNERFKDKVNLIIGEKDSGKSSLARSILYTFGCDVKSFDFPKKFPDNIYIIDFNIGNDNYVLIRKKLKDGKGKNFFKIIKNNEEFNKYYDTTSFKNYLNEIMNIQLITMNKDRKETKLFPNHIFLPFYTDQDYSWQDYLNSTFAGVKFINGHKKVILEYFTGTRSNKYYILKLEKDKLIKELAEINAFIISKKAIVEENNRSIHIIENIHVDKFIQQYKYMLEIYNNVIETEHRLKNELNKKIYEKNSLLEIKADLDLSIDEIVTNELNSECPNCHQKIDKSMEENYLLIMTQQNLIKEREKVTMYLHGIEEKISISMNEIESLKDKSGELEAKITSDANLVELSERADSYALSRINEKLLDELSELEIKKNEIEESLETVEEQLGDLNRIDTATEYKSLMINAFKDMNIPFSYKNYYESNLESVNIMLSGATKVQAFIAQYLCIYEMIIKCENTINIPMFIDTYLKDDFNDEEVSRTSKYVFDSLKDNHQSFIFISNNKQTLNSIDGYDVNRIHLTAEDNLLTKSYESIYERYANLIKEI